MNKVILIGRLTADPELRQTQSGISSCRFTVAVNRRFKNDKGEYEADFLTCVAWRQTAEFVSRYFTKGKMIVVEGSLRSGKYQDKNHEDVTHYTTDVYVDNVEFCGDKSGSDNAAAPTAPTAPTAYTGTQQQAPAPTPKAAAPTPQPEFNLSDFEEILSDGDVPF